MCKELKNSVNVFPKVNKGVMKALFLFAFTIIYCFTQTVKLFLQLTARSVKMILP